MINLYLASAGRYVLGIYPISFGNVGEGGGPQRVGMLIMQRDLLRQLTHARRTAEKQRSGTSKDRVGVPYRRRRL